MSATIRDARAAMANGKLTTKQEAFVAAYLGAAHGNATEAARMAGYAVPRQEGSRLLSNAVIAARVSQHVEERYAKADEVLAELASVAFAEWHDFVEVTGRAKDGEATKVRSDIASKVKALELLGKYHQLFTDKIDHGGEVGMVAISEIRVPRPDEDAS